MDQACADKGPGEPRCGMSVAAARIYRCAKLGGADLTGANLTITVYPEDLPVPTGWVRDPSSGRLRPASEGTGDAAN